MPFDSLPGELTIEDLTSARFDKWLKTGRVFCGHRDDEKHCPIANWIRYELGEPTVEAREVKLKIGDESFSYPQWALLFIRRIDRSSLLPLTKWAARRYLRQITRQLQQHKPLVNKEMIKEVLIFSARQVLVTTSTTHTDDY